LDLVADVLQQADVSNLKQATLKLNGAAKPTFAEIAQNSAPAIEGKAFLRKDQARLTVSENDPKLAKILEGKHKVMRGLEAMLATKMVEAMMPRGQDELYGEGTAGEVWRGFHIEAMGQAIADQNMLNISKRPQNEEQRSQAKTIKPFAG
jgi:peptidoglycan hydrolase FlgJ